MALLHGCLVRSSYCVQLRNSSTTKYTLYRASLPLLYNETHRPHRITLDSRRQMSSQTFAHYLSAENPPIGYTIKILDSCHDLTGLPWWLTIAATTVALRGLITVPLAVYSSHVLARVTNLQPELKQMALKLRQEIALEVKNNGWEPKYATAQFRANMSRLQAQLYVRDNCHPMKTTIVAWFQIPLWITLSLALRNMSGSLYYHGTDNSVLHTDFATQGALWFPDLLLADTTFILPLCVTVFNLINVEMMALTPNPASTLSKMITNVLRVVSVVMLPIAATVPSSMSFYWTCSSAFSILQNILLRIPKVKRTLGIPKLPNESVTPFKDMAKLARQKYLRQKVD